MTYFRPCKNCIHASESCERREAVRKAIAGASITSVAFRCDKRVPIYTVGQRVAVTWSVNSSCDPEYPEWSPETWPATVVAERGTKFQILVDDVPSDCETPARSFLKNESLYAKVTAPKLAPLDELARNVCKVCQGVRQADGSIAGCFAQEPSSGIGGHFSGYWPTNCMKVAPDGGPA
jgi:hypothetical protein